MFLIPAFTAFTADTVAIYLHANYRYLLEHNGGFWSIQNIVYLLPLSIIRLLFLIPYNYHTYSGTRLKFPGLYTSIHTISGIVVFSHLVAFSIYAEKDLGKITNNDDDNVNVTSEDDFDNVLGSNRDVNVNSSSLFNDNNNNNTMLGVLIDDQHYNYYTATSNILKTNELEQLYSSNNSEEVFDEVYVTNDESNLESEYELIWILLTLSLCSICLHIVILLHVRSTAPSHDAIRQKFEEGQSFEDNDGGCITSSSSSLSTNGGNNGWVGGVGNTAIPKNRKMLAYWVYDRYRRENDVESFDGGQDGESVFTSKIMKRHAVQPLSPINSSDTNCSRYTLAYDEVDEDDPDLSISDNGGDMIDGDLSEEYSSDDYNEFIDAEEGHSYSGNNHQNGVNGSDEKEKLLMDNYTVDSNGPDFVNHISFDDNLHFFQGEDDLNALDSSPLPRSARRRTRRKIEMENASPSSSWRTNSLRGLVDIHACLSKQGYDDFLSEIRSRFKEAKREWDLRLDEVFNGIRKNETGAHALLPFRQHTPFRALLHLYAHEDVFLNRKLDRAFSYENPSALSFYAPQLLCFLLHNAYLSTGRLEKWILEKCKTNTQFAHQCFWFLRAWCLQGGIYRPEDDIPDHDNMTGLEGFQVPDLMSSKSGKSSNPDLTSLKSGKLSMPLSPESESASIPPLRTNSVHSFSDTMHSFSEIKSLVKHPSAQDLKNGSGVKLLPDERSAVENLLSKIIDCGELSTRKTELGSDYNSVRYENESQPMESSPLHSVDITSTSNGFSEIRGYSSEKTSVRIKENGEELQSYFLRTPDFLDSLMAIADDLIMESRTNRTAELRKRLSALEASMLPSHSIYVPVNGSMHYICRIVASESFAISTKERVPCIVYLEVIDHVNLSDKTNSNTEEGILRKWYTAPRPPQRHNTIFTKVSKGLKKLRDEFEENHERLFRDSASIDENLPVFITQEEKTELNPQSKSSNLVFKENWETKVNRIRVNSTFSNHPNWRLLPILIKTNDDIRQEQLAAQMIHCMAQILARAKIPVWLYPYDILALSFRGGIIEAIPDTISIDSLRKKHPELDLKSFFHQQFGEPGCDTYENAKANFVESLAAYSIVCFLLQLKDRHNGNIMLDNKGHLVHIDFGFYFLSSPGKNSGFESAPFKLTRDFVDVMDGANSHNFMKFRELCYRTFLELRRNCFQITLLVQMLIEGNEDLDCFRNNPHEAVRGLQERFRLDLNDKACVEYVNSLINDSLENWTTTCYDRYQRWCTGIM